MTELTSADKSADRPSQPNLVVMGVAGCGKSLIGALLATALGAEPLEGDAFHRAENVARMSAGIALTDADRAGWLADLSERIAQARAQGRHIVLSCSALKRRYRDVLRQGDPALVFVYLHGERALIEARMASRTHHFMPVTLLDSQFRDLEVPQADEDALVVDIANPPEFMVAQVLAALCARIRNLPDPRKNNQETA
jgi:gluconokinase